MREPSRDRHLMLVETMVEACPPRRSVLRARVVTLFEQLMAPLARRRGAPVRAVERREPPPIRWEM